MSPEDWNTVFVVSGVMILPLVIVFLIYLLCERNNYAGGQGSDDPRGYNEWTTL